MCLKIHLYITERFHIDFDEPTLLCMNKEVYYRYNIIFKIYKIDVIF